MKDDPAKMSPLEAYKFGYALAEAKLEVKFNERLYWEQRKSNDLSKRYMALCEEIAKGYQHLSPPIIYWQIKKCEKCGAESETEYLKPVRVF